LCFSNSFVIIALVTARRAATRSESRHHDWCLASLFSPTLIRSLPDPSAVSAIREIISATSLCEVGAATELRQIFEQAYDRLLGSYRCEYLYKNAIAAKILMVMHSLATAGVLTELQVDDCKLDLLLVNGNSVAYEIKTELDSPDRLPSQLSTYQRAFECVYLVTHENCAPKFTSDLPSGVGILQLSSRYTLETVRPAEIDHSRLDPTVIFNMFRRPEYEAIIRKYFGSVPSVPNTRIYTECRRLFLELPISSVCAEAMAAFHVRSRQALAVSMEDVEDAPHSLLLHVLRGNIGHHQYQALSSIMI